MLRPPLFALSFFGMMIASSPAQSVSMESGQTLQILDQQELDFGTHSVIFNRVETPFLKPQADKVVAVAAPQTPTAAELEQLRQREAKPEVSLLLSATVYDHAVTEVRWSREEGDYIFWSSIDFNLLRGLGTFETTATRYAFTLGIGNESRAEVTAWNAVVDAERLDPELKFRIPSLTVSAGTAPQYKIISLPKTGVHREVEQAMDALHRYYDANREQLLRAYQESEIARIAEEKRIREHLPEPAAPKDTVINYFPIQSVYLGETENAR